MKGREPRKGTMILLSTLTMIVAAEARYTFEIVKPPVVPCRIEAS